MYSTVKIQTAPPERAFRKRREYFAIHVLWTGFALSFCCFFPTPSLFAHRIQTHQDQEKPESIDELILQLGHSDFALRSSAEEDLEKLGAPAIAPLRKALTNKNSDNEIRLRARRLLILIERRAKEQKTKDFLSGKGESIDFVGWTKFSKLTGSDKSARKLFIRLHQSQPKILRTAFPNPIKTSTKASSPQITKAPQTKRLEQEFEVFARSLYLGTNGNASRLIPNLSVAMFLAGNKYQTASKQDQTISLNDESYQKIIRVLEKPQMIATIKNSQSEKAIIALLSNWLETVPNEPIQLMASKISIVQNYKLESSLKIIVDVATNKNAPVRIRATALETISRMGQREQCASLTALFDDDSQVGNYLPIKPKTNDKANAANNGLMKKDLLEVQIRDLALATVILLNEKDIKQFGFLPTAFENKGLFFSQAGFLTEEFRDQAFQKWSEADKTSLN